MGKFKKGVRVRLTADHDDSATAGMVGTIVGKDESGDRDVIFDGFTEGHSGLANDGSTNHWFVPKSKLEVVVDEPATEETWVPKVGDRVKTDSSFSFDPSAGTVASIHAGYVRVKVDGCTDDPDYKWAYQPHEIQPLPVAAEAQPAVTERKFKVGDVVNYVIDGKRQNCWQGVTITSDDGEFYHATCPTHGEGAFYDDWLELAEPVAVAPATATVKVGDRVAITGDVMAGRTGTLVRIDEAGDYLVAIDGYTDGHDGDLGDGSRNHRWFFGGEGVSRLEELAPAKFKVGDRVIGDCGFSFDPAEGVVTSVNDGWIGVKVPSHHEPDYEWAYPTEAVELITAEPANNNTITLTLKVDSEPVADALRTIAAALNRAANEIAA